MTTKVRITLEERPSYPIEVKLATSGKAPRYSSPQFLNDAGDSCEVYVHQGQDIVIGEIKATKA